MAAVMPGWGILIGEGPHLLGVVHPAVRGRLRAGDGPRLSQPASPAAPNPNRAPAMAPYSWSSGRSAELDLGDVAVLVLGDDEQVDQVHDVMFAQTVQLLECTACESLASLP